MVHTFEEVCTRTPADPNEAAPGGHHAAGGMGGPPPGSGPGPVPPLHPPNPPPMAPSPQPPGLCQRRPHPTPPPPHREGKGHGQGEGKGQRGTLWQRGQGSAQGDRQAPIGTGHRERHNVGAGTNPRARKGREQGPRGRKRGPGPTRKKGIPRRRDQRPPPQADTARPPGTHAPNTRRQSANQTTYGSHRHTPTSHRKPHGRGRAHLHGENKLHPQRKPQGTTPRSPPPRPHRQATTPATTRATTQAPEEDEGTATAPRARDRDPQGRRDHGTGPQRGQPHGHLPDPLA